ncbi:probable peroxidase 61 [Chenopodium quinoa]|uniref:Peroxidase n=1 Tax=Chenopodium quinoa TaxID=63459 RepID=A0A803M5V2_CHEQI|nr:probable peroxidase 61 [Chenopodium quinoa]
MEEGKQLYYPLVALLALVVGFLMIGDVEGAITVPRYTLTRSYYKKTNTCYHAEAYVKHLVKEFWDQDKSITPKLLRLVYSDCMVTGCDASILLDGPDSEQKAPQNTGLGGFAFIDKIKEVLEERCPGVVSCADILQLATRDAAYLSGAPSYPILTGRKDGFTSKASSVDLPSPNISWEEGFAYFQARGLDIQDFTTLLGAHSTGRTRCRYIYDRLYNFQGTGKPDPTLDTSSLEDLRKQCPQKYQKGEHEGLIALNKGSDGAYRFTNDYYKNIMANKAVLRIDQDLLYGNETQQLSDQFAHPGYGLEDFRRAFALSMNRLGIYKALTGQQGEVRKNCHKRNSY